MYKKPLAYPTQERFVQTAPKDSTLTTTPKVAIHKSVHDLFKALGITYAGCNAFAQGCEAFSTLSKEDFLPYQEEPQKYDQLTNAYGQLIGKGYVAPGYIRWISAEVGYGFFASRDLPAGNLVVEYVGKIMPRSDVSDTAWSWKYPKHGTFSDRLPTEISLNAGPYGNEARFINHSDTPNLTKELIFHAHQWHLLYMLEKDIQAGEEFLVSYGENYWNKRKKLTW